MDKNACQHNLLDTVTDQEYDFNYEPSEIRFQPTYEILSELN